MSERASLEPLDVHDRRRLANVRPPDWKNPTPDGIYDLVVLGAGTGGLISALVASSLGARVALVERHLMGGDCLNVGCVPSKALLRAGQRVRAADSARDLGLAASGQPDFAAAMERMRRIRAEISEDDSAARYTEEFGIDVYFGHARFAGPDRVDVEGATLRFRRAVIATGARASAPPIPGLEAAGYLTNESVFELRDRPRRLAVLGAGPIGCELAQAFRRLGSEVTLIEQFERILIREDADAARLVQEALEREGVRIVLGSQIERVERRAGDRSLRWTDPARGPQELLVDEILVGAGRAPNVEDLGLERVGVQHDRGGVRVDDFLRTTNRRIFAVGDVCMQWKFTHAADAAAKIAVQNALFALGPIGRRRLSGLVMPWCTYTEPELAHVGWYASEAEQRGVAIDTYQAPMARANRAVTDGTEEGFVKVHVRKGTDRIVGATVVGRHAGDLILPITLAMKHGIGLGAFTHVIFPYPTQAEVIRAAAGAYTRTRLTPATRRLLGLLLRLHR